MTNSYNPHCPKCGTILDYIFEDEGCYNSEDVYLSRRIGYCPKCGKDTKYLWTQEYTPSGFSEFELVDDDGDYGEEEDNYWDW